MTARVVVIGGDAAGGTAASHIKRQLGDAVDVVMIERDDDTSYSACGIPYWIAGDVPARERLVARSPEEHRANGIDVRTLTEATAIDPDNRTVTVRGRGGQEVIGYDHLLIATGAEPRRPRLSGIRADGVVGVQTLDDGDHLMAELARDPKRAVVVGSGYVGLEMAEALVRRGLDVTVVDRGDEPMGMLDPSLGHRVAEALRGMDIRLATGTDVTGFSVRSGRVIGVESADEIFPADLVVLGLGVQARTRLARDAGLLLGASDGIVTDSWQKVSGREGVWAAGDCVVTHDRLTGRLVHVPLGTHANKQGLVAGRSIVAAIRGEEPPGRFPGIVRTAITKVCDLEIGVTGLTEELARESGFDPVAASIETTTSAGYFPGAQPLTVRVVADASTRRLLGGQIIGREGAAWRIDTLAMALWSYMTVDDLVMTDLAYAPPFSSVWDPVQVAARAVIREIDAR